MYYPAERTVHADQRTLGDEWGSGMEISFKCPYGCKKTHVKGFIKTELAKGAVERLVLCGPRGKPEVSRDLRILIAAHTKVVQEIKLWDGNRKCSKCREYDHDRRACPLFWVAFDDSR